jgi:hypothetical protein
MACASVGGIQVQLFNSPAMVQRQLDRVAALELAATRAVRHLAETPAERAELERLLLLGVITSLTGMDRSRHNSRALAEFVHCPTARSLRDILFFALHCSTREGLVFACEPVADSLDSALRMSLRQVMQIVSHGDLSCPGARARFSLHGRDVHPDRVPSR